MSRYSKISYQKFFKWVWEYNNQRPHSGKYCFGKTPMQTFLDSISLAKEKYIDELSDKKTVNISTDEAETGSAGEQLVTNNLSDWNGQGVGLILMPTSIPGENA